MFRIQALALVVTVAGAAASAEPADYASPQDALDAMVAALEARDHEALLTVFGPEAEDLLFTGEPELDSEHRARLLDAYGAGYRFGPRDEGGVDILLGADGCCAQHLGRLLEGGS